MIELLTRKKMFCLRRCEQQEHGDAHQHFFWQSVEELPDFRLALQAVETLKIGVDNPETNGHGTVSASFNLRVRMSTFVLCQAVKDIDVQMKPLSVRAGKGDKDRFTTFPATLTPLLQNHPAA